MRRHLIPATALGLLVAALGCHHVGGKCDCGYHPDDGLMTAAHNPYYYQPATGAAKPAADAKAPAELPKDELPKDKDGK